MSTIGASSASPLTPPTTPVTPATTPSTATSASPVALTSGGPFAGTAAFDEVASGARQMELGESGPHVKVLEDVLEGLGYKLPGLAVPDARLTRATTNMISRFQRDHSLARTGILDAATLGAIDAAHAVATDPLAGKTYIDASTFAGSAGSGWARDNVELESTMMLSGVDPKELVKLVRAERGGRTSFQRLRRSRLSEAMTVGYGIDEMPWDRRSHRLREGNPNLWLTIESGRYEPDAETGERELSVGTDIMDDVYYDTEDFSLLNNDMSLRGRIRWDNADSVRRLLIAAKFGSEVSDLGLKSAAKIDVRTDRPSADEVEKLNDSVLAGRDSWSGGAAKPIRAIYDRLVTADALPDVGSHENVLMLEPKAYLRSTRSRYHLNEASRRDVFALYESGGKGRLEGLAKMVETSLASGALSGGDERDVRALQAKIAGALDATLVAERAAEALKELDPSFDPTPDNVRALMPTGSSSPPRAKDRIELEKRRAVAEAQNGLLHEIADDVDDVRRALTGAEDRSLEDHADFFMAWEKSTDKVGLGKLTTFDRFAELHQEMAKLPDAELQTKLDAYNAYGEAQKAAGEDDFEDFEPLALGQFKALGSSLQNEKVRLWRRQLEAAGSAAQGLWFQEARAFYVPSAASSWGNLLIDTMDYVEMVRPEDWSSIPEADRKPGIPIPEDKIFHAGLVNEVQIELGKEKPYVDRIRDLKAEIQTDRSSLLMRWADDVKHPALGGDNDAAAYRKMHDALVAMDDQTLEGTLRSLNDFLKAQGSALAPLTAGDLRGLDHKDLVQKVRDHKVRTEPTLEQSLAGTEWIFEQYKETLREVSGMKSRRVLRTLGRAGGPSSMRWTEATSSKGDTALTILRDGARP